MTSVKKLPTKPKNTPKKKTPSKKVEQNIDTTTEPVVNEPVTENTEPTEPTEPTETLVNEVTDMNNVEEKIDPTVESIQQLISKFEMFEKESKLAKTELRKVLKSYQKKTFKKTRKHDPNRPPTGFAKPSLISEQLCKFLNKPSGTKMARTDVTKEVNKYIKANNLQNPTNKKEIKADTSLIKLLNLSKSNINDLNYFSLQKYLAPHFPKTDTSVSV